MVSDSRFAGGNTARQNMSLSGLNGVLPSTLFGVLFGYGPSADSSVAGCMKNESPMFRVADEVANFRVADNTL